MAHSEPEVIQIAEQWLGTPPHAVHELRPDKVYRVDTDSGVFTLKDRGPVATARTDALEFHANVVQHLDARGVVVAMPVRDRSGRLWLESGGHAFTVTRFIPATTCPEAGPDLDVFCGNAARAIARLHIALASYPMDDVLQHTWREDLPGGLARNLLALRGSLSAQQRHHLDRAVDGHLEPMQRGLTGLPEQLIHRDCHPGNLLADGTQVVGFVDCDHFCIGPRLFDLAYFAIHLVKWHVTKIKSDLTDVWLARLPSILANYQAVNPLSPIERAALPAAMAAILVLFGSFFATTDRHGYVRTELDALSWLTENQERILAACHLA